MFINSIDDLIKTKPYFESNIHKFWIDEQLTNYALQKGLKDIRVFIAQDRYDNISRVLYNGMNAEFESKVYEDIAVHIDIMAVEKEFPNG